MAKKHFLEKSVVKKNFLEKKYLHILTFSRTQESIFTLIDPKSIRKSQYLWFDE